MAGQRTPFSAARVQSRVRSTTVFVRLYGPAWPAHQRSPFPLQGSNTAVARQAKEKKSHLGRWKGLDEDVSDDQVPLCSCH